MVKHKKTNLLGEFSYYVLLLMLILFSLGLAFLIMPLLIFGGSIIADITMIIIGLAFGLFITYFVKDLDHLTHHHHAGIWFVMIFASLLSFSFIYFLGYNLFEVISNTINSTKILFASLWFIIGFMLPYVLYLLDEHKNLKTRNEH